MTEYGIQLFLTGCLFLWFATFMGTVENKLSFDFYGWVQAVLACMAISSLPLILLGGLTAIWL